MLTFHSPSLLEPSPEAAGFSAHRLQRLSSLIEADVERGEIPGAVALVLRDGVCAFYKAFGWSERATRIPMQPDCLFRIASMTKPLTVTAALLLMEQGRLLLSDPIARYLPSLKDLKVGIESMHADTGERRLTYEAAKRPITVHDLTRHTAGFTYGHFGDSLVQRAYRTLHPVSNAQNNVEMLAKLAQLPLAYQPGSTFEYGMSTDVLGHLIEVVSGVSLQDFFTEQVTGPLGMHDTGFGLDPRHAARLAEPQRDPSRPNAVTMPFDPALATTWYSGGGGLISTAPDYARFCQMLLNGGELAGTRLLARSSVKLMLQNHLSPSVDYGPRTSDLGIAAPLPQLGQGYGLGLGVRVSDGLSPVPGSAGDFYWGGVLGPYFWVDPKERLIVVFMLQELNVQKRARYRALLRSLIYQALH